jgi:hypothetical protein
MDQKEFINVILCESYRFYNYYVCKTWKNVIPRKLHERSINTERVQKIYTHSDRGYVRIQP